MRNSIVYPRTSACILFALAASLALPGPSPAAEAETVDQEPTLEIRVEEALSEQRPRDRLNRLAETGRALSLEEIPEALDLSKELEQLRERAVLQEATLKRWSELRPALAFDHIANLPESRLKVDVIRYATARFANEDARQAADAVANMRPGRSRNDATQVVAEAWANADLTAALQWAEGLPGGFARESALERIRFVWVHADPVTAVDHVLALPSSDIKNALITNIAGAWAATDPDAALEWAEELSQGVERRLALLNAVESWADHDPAAGAARALELEPVDLRRNAVAAVASRWAGQDPETAIEWAVGITDFESRWRAAEAVIAVWAPFDPDAAAAWLKEVEAGPGRERLIRLYVDSVGVWAPGMAARMAATTADEAQRNQRVASAIGRWIELDRSAAEEWLDRTDFSDELKKRWLSTPASTGSSRPYPN